MLVLLHAELVNNADSTWVEYISSVELDFNSLVAHTLNKSTFKVINEFPFKLPELGQ